MTIPVVPRKVWNHKLTALDDEDEDDNEMLPPHEIVPRRSTILPKMTFSMLEGVGRLLFCDATILMTSSRIGLKSARQPFELSTIGIDQ
ncbi:hypothetical protein Acr_11g0007050 [Actinidia rufa]|uniref:Uncharacterized protein n=1 Tax=Actinidia rufa TaxID=165716 RepID=A0A7J0FDX9_9ERIC|nr:hypothetical protein Acr_11g0007050 [Actinidia rufa]